LRPDFSRKYVKILDVKTSFIDIMSEVQKDSEDVSAGLGIFFLIHKNFDVKVGKVNLTSPSIIGVKRLILNPFYFAT
jgi:hypothetical protein